MAKIHPFICVRPNPTVVSRVAALPYDVYSRKEAKKEAEREPLSFLNIDRPETQFAETEDMYAPFMYQKAREMYDSQKKSGIYVTETNKAFYLYELTMNQRTQTGIVACASVDDYLNQVIKKHENTREEKELDRIHHVDAMSAQTGPIFLAYRSRLKIQLVVQAAKKQEPLYDFVSEDNIRHRVWKIEEQDRISVIKEEFDKIEHIYIADGHHRCASAVKVGIKRRQEAKFEDKEAEYNYFLCVLFPEEELNILPYYRVVKDLHGYSERQFLERIQESFELSECKVPMEPDQKGTFVMYLMQKWYLLKAKEHIKDDKDPVNRLDVALLQNYLLGPILGIKDPKTDDRIDFIGGIRGIMEVKRRVDKIDGMVGFVTYPTSMQELFAVADANCLMPPKSTWFEPKLRSGLFIHEI